MKAPRLSPLVGLLLSLVLVFSAGCRCCRQCPCCDFGKGDGGRIQILEQPASLMVHEGRTATFRVVVATNPAELKPVYQWYFNKTAIAGATNATYTLRGVRHEDAGAYRVEVSASPAVMSNAAYLTVCTAVGNAGYLSVPVGLFVTGYNTSCPGFDRVYTAVPFLGPGCAAPATNPFPNPFNRPYLTVDTCRVEPWNVSPLDTCVVILKDRKPFQGPQCNDDASPVCSGNSNLKLSRATRMLETATYYRASIFYKKATLGNNTVVVFNWQYHEAVQVGAPLP